MTIRIPLARPSPAKLSEAIADLQALEDRAIFSNFGPLSISFEQKMVGQIFGGVGECLTVCNATIGLMIAIRQAMMQRPAAKRRYALMPSFTFAAAAQAALWNRLTPLFCDINPLDWSADAHCEAELLERYKDEIAVVVPYATFGYDIDLDWYEKIQRDYGIPVVIDAAASLGTISANGCGFGTGFSGAVIYSMHVTKSFATSEGGLVYSADAELIQTLRTMSNFGFGEPRNATMMGLNGKMTEVSALLASLRLESFDEVMQRRSELVGLYREALPELSFQPAKARRQAHQFTSTLLPKELAPSRSAVQAELSRSGIGSACYFSPHVAEQDYFRDPLSQGRLPVTDEIASRALTLPLFDAMTDAQVHEVSAAVREALAIAGERGVLVSGETLRRA